MILVKYFSKDDADHLLNSIKNHYAISIDWQGRNYLGLTIYWNYKKIYVDIDARLCDKGSQSTTTSQAKKTIICPTSLDNNFLQKNIPDGTRSK